MTTKQEYINQITEQSKKPIEQQLEDLKSAGADFLVALDKIADQLENVLNKTS